MGAYGQYVGHVFQCQAEIKVKVLCFKLAGRHLGKIKDVVDNPEKRIRTVSDRLRVFTLFLGQFRIKQQARHADNAVHGRPDLVAHVGQKLALCLIGCLCLHHQFIGARDRVFKQFIRLCQLPLRGSALLDLHPEFIVHLLKVNRDVHCRESLLVHLGYLCVEFTCSRLHHLLKIPALQLQFFSRCCELHRHLIECPGKLPDLIPCAGADSVIEIPFHDLFGSVVQILDWRCYGPGNRDGNQKPGNEQKSENRRYFLRQFGDAGKRFIFSHLRHKSPVRLRYTRINPNDIRAEIIRA